MKLRCTQAVVATVMTITNATPTVTFLTKPICRVLLRKLAARWWGVNTSFALMAGREAGAVG